MSVMNLKVKYKKKTKWHARCEPATTAQAGALTREPARQTAQQATKATVLVNYIRLYNQL